MQFCCALFLSWKSFESSPCAEDDYVCRPSMKQFFRQKPGTVHDISPPSFSYKSKRSLCCDSSYKTCRLSTSSSYGSANKPCFRASYDNCTRNLYTRDTSLTMDLSQMSTRSLPRTEYRPAFDHQRRRSWSCCATWAHESLRILQQAKEIRKKENVSISCLKRFMQKIKIINLFFN